MRQNMYFHQKHLKSYKTMIHSIDVFSCVTHEEEEKGLITTEGLKNIKIAQRLTLRAHKKCADAPNATKET